MKRVDGSYRIANNCGAVVNEVYVKNVASYPYLR